MRLDHTAALVMSWAAPLCVEAPTFEAFQAFSMEPEVMKISSVDTMDIKAAMTLEEAGQMMMQMMQAK